MTTNFPDSNLKTPLFRSTSIDTRTIAEVEDLYRREQRELLRNFWSQGFDLSREEVLDALLSEKIKDMSILGREVYERLLIESILENRKEQNWYGSSGKFLYALTDVLRLGASQELRDFYVNGSVRDRRGGQLEYGLYTESRVEEFSYGKQSPAAESIYGELIKDILKNFKAPQELAANLATHLGDADIFHAISFFQSLNRHLSSHAIPPLQQRPIACALSSSVLLLAKSLVPKLVSASESSTYIAFGNGDLTISNDELLDMHFRATFVCAMAYCLFSLTQGNAHCFCALTDSLNALKRTGDLRSSVDRLARDVQDYFSPLLAQCSVPSSEVERIVRRELQAFSASLAPIINSIHSGIRQHEGKLLVLRNLASPNTTWESLRAREWRAVETMMLDPNPELDPRHIGPRGVDWAWEEVKTRPSSL